MTPHTERNSLCQSGLMSITRLYSCTLLLCLNIIISNNLHIWGVQVHLVIKVSPAHSFEPQMLLLGAAAPPSLFLGLSFFIPDCPLLFLRETAPSHHCNREANNASMPPSFPHFVSRAASPSTPSSYDSLFFVLPTSPHIFAGVWPPIVTFLSIPMHFFSFFQAPSTREAVLSVYQSIGLAHLWAGLQRQHHFCIWLYSASEGKQRRRGRPGGASLAV